MAAKIKTCCVCKEEKPVTDFRRDRSRLDGYQSSCKVCARSFQSKRYQEKYAVSRRDRDAALRAENGEKIRIIKQQRGCICCGESDVVCLDFHHTTSDDKEFGISSNTHRTWKYIEAEIDKCVVICANCHRKLHAGRVELPNNGSVAERPIALVC